MRVCVCSVRVKIEEIIRKITLNVQCTKNALIRSVGPPAIFLLSRHSFQFKDKEETSDDIVTQIKVKIGEKNFIVTKKL